MKSDPLEGRVGPYSLGSRYACPVLCYKRSEGQVLEPKIYKRKEIIRTLQQKLMSMYMLSTLQIDPFLIDREIMSAILKPEIDDINLHFTVL